MSRITTSQLEEKVKRLNELTNSPQEVYTKDGDGKLRANIGNYHLSGAYGGYSLHRVCNNAGATWDVFSCGHITKKELAERIDAYTIKIRPVE